MGEKRDEVKHISNVQTGLVIIDERPCGVERLPIAVLIDRVKKKCPTRTSW